MNPTLTKTSDEPLEFYEHRTNKDPITCEHIFKRLSPTRVVCQKCGIGFFDNPFNPFPVEEINKQTRNLKKENKKFKERLENN